MLIFRKIARSLERASLDSFSGSSYISSLITTSQAKETPDV